MKVWVHVVDNTDDTRFIGVSRRRPDKLKLRYVLHRQGCSDEEMDQATFEFSNKTNEGFVSVPGKCLLQYFRSEVLP